MVRTTLWITYTGLREVGRAVQDHTRGGQREQNSVPQMFVSDFFVYWALSTEEEPPRSLGISQGTGGVMVAVQNLVHVGEGTKYR